MCSGISLWFKLASPWCMLFMCLFDICIYSVKCLFKSFADFYLVFYYWVLRVPYIYSLYSSISYIRCKYFLPVCSLSFHSLGSVFEDNKIEFILIFFMDYAFGIKSKESFINHGSQKNSDLFSFRSCIRFRFYTKVYNSLWIHFCLRHRYESKIANYASSIL